MANSAIWNNNPTFISGASTPFGFYDNDIQFQTDALRVAHFCATRLGYPSMDVEMSDKQFFTCFEEAISTYGTEVYMNNIVNNFITLEASPTSSNLNNQFINPSLHNIINIAQDYGAEVGVGGTTEWYTGQIELNPGQQTYDLTAWASGSASLAPGDTIEVKQVFYENIPAIMRYFDPYAGTGYGSQQLLDAFGFGTQSPAINFMLMPLNFDMSVLQAIELNDTIRKSGFSFNIINNKLQIFPIPTRYQLLTFKYVKNSEKNRILSPEGTYGSGNGVITDLSNVPYQQINYSTINQPGRFWIFEYTLVLAKELLGFIRGKYQTTPIPGDSVSLNQQDLFSSSDKDKASLIEKLRKDLEETSRRAQLKRKEEENASLKQTLTDFPMPIWIG
jgi:hypothetical protein